jgi:hypothetical protein
MASILHSAAQRINASTAGLTKPHVAEPNPGAPAAGTMTEAFHRVINTASGDLDALFRQEPVYPTPTSAAPTSPTTALRGPHGGMIPSSLSHLAHGAEAELASPGPTMAVAPSSLPTTVPEWQRAAANTGVGAATRAAATDATATGKHWLSTLRRRLGV